MTVITHELLVIQSNTTHPLPAPTYILSHMTLTFLHDYKPVVLQNVSLQVML